MHTKKSIAKCGGLENLGDVTIRYSVCDFLLTFYSNYGFI